MKIWSFIKLMRPVNLVIIVFTMVAIRFWVVETLITHFGFELQLSPLYFTLLVLSVVCIAAAGNVINDYFDAKIDTINKPDEVIIGFGVTRRVAMAAHFVLSIAGILLGAFLAYKVGRLNLVAIHIFCAATLWYYSTVFKKELLLGNFIVALLASLVPIIVGLFEMLLLVQRYSGEVIDKIRQVGFNPIMYTFYWVLGFACFAFLLNFLREIQKDLADVKGDSENNRETLPIVMGYKFTKWVVTAIVIFIICLLCLVSYVQAVFADHLFSLVYFTVLIGIPLVISTIITWQATTRKKYLLAGNIVKFVMLAGILYSYFIEQLLAG